MDQWPPSSDKHPIRLFIYLKKNLFFTPGKMIDANINRREIIKDKQLVSLFGNGKCPTKLLYGNNTVNISC